MFMKSLITVLATVLFLGSAGAALADEAKGKIQTVDPTARTIQLEDGTMYTVAEGVALDTLKPGTEVTVSFEEKDGTKNATDVKPAM
jgi:Cu/Ag efflux protein CusF